VVANYDLGSFSDDLKVLINSLFAEVCSILENKSMSKDRRDFFTRRIKMLSADFSFRMKRESSGEGDLVGFVDEYIKIGSSLWTIKKDLLAMK
jgi:hypothetical protein